jgi:PA domain-containing protein/flagellar hook capping protein FlgD
MRARSLAWVLASAAFAFAEAHAATITVIDLDSAGEGFNDPTPATPVGGNPGTTVGAQRLFVFQYAANVWASLLPSPVVIRIGANFNPQSCTATSGVLGSAGPETVHRDFPNAPFSGTWYHQALANRLAGADLAPANDDIAITFNSSVGGMNCLPAGWYYGVDGNEGSQIELLPVVLHEMGHGLGFSTTTDGQTGTLMGGFPGAYDHFLFDDTAQKHWTQMTSGEISASAVNCTNVVWDGQSVTANAATYLGPKPLLHVTAPAGLAGDYPVGLASFGPSLSTSGLSGAVVLAVDGVGLPNNACEPLTNAGAMAGKIALLDRGGCTFTVKVKNAQDAGAIAAIVADSLPGCPPGAMGGTDPTITIPSVRVTQDLGNQLKAALASGLAVTLILDPSQHAGTDAAGRVYLFTPNPYQAGSSVSHWDTSANPDLLMEPALSPSLSQSVDLTLNHFIDIGWIAESTSTDNTPSPGTTLGVLSSNPTRGTTTIGFSLPKDEDVNLAVFDLRGRLVSGLVAGAQTAGNHVVQWSGKDLFGREMPSGVYLCQLRTRTARMSEHLVLVH